VASESKSSKKRQRSSRDDMSLGDDDGEAPRKKRPSTKGRGAGGDDGESYMDEDYSDDDDLASASDRHPKKKGHGRKSVSFAADLIEQMPLPGELDDDDFEDLDDDDIHDVRPSKAKGAKNGSRSSGGRKGGSSQRKQSAHDDDDLDDEDYEDDMDMLDEDLMDEDVGLGSTREAVLYCVCRRPEREGDTFIECDACKQWFHPTCVGLSNDNAPTSWACPSCRPGAGAGGANKNSKKKGGGGGGGGHDFGDDPAGGGGFGGFHDDDDDDDDDDTDMGHGRSGYRQHQQAAFGSGAGTSRKLNAHANTNAALGDGMAPGALQARNAPGLLKRSPQKVPDGKENLFCVCKTPEQEGALYIFCETCTDW
jgi:hypothetical protein